MFVLNKSNGCKGNSKNNSLTIMLLRNITNKNDDEDVKARGCSGLMPRDFTSM